MITVKMLIDRKGSEDGFSVQQYNHDEVYTLTDGLGRSFIAEGSAIKIKEVSNAE